MVMTLRDCWIKGKPAIAAIAVGFAVLLTQPQAAHATEATPAAEAAAPGDAPAVSVNPARAATDDLVKGYAKEWQLGMQNPASPVQERLHGVSDFLHIIATAITIFVLVLLAYTCLRFREKRNPVPSRVSHNTLIEIIWTTVPILILIAIAIPSLRLHNFMYKLEEPDLTLRVTGYQWYWGYSYPDIEGVSYESRMIPQEEIKPEAGQIRLLSVDNPVVVPVGKTIRVQVTASDVIHSFAMPAFGIKTDAVPGRLNETWFRAEEPGIYYGQCSELCGVYHGFMPIEIRAVEPEVFEQWTARAKTGEYALDGLSIPKDKNFAQSDQRRASSVE